jgi:hypothetical protein
MNPEPPTQQENTDAQHLKLLSIFHYVVAGLAALFACMPLIHVAMGMFMVIAPQKFGPPNNQPPAFIGWLFIAMGSVFILAGWTLAVLVLLTGRFIAGRKHYTYCLVVACIECIFMPFGTVLGVFTILVLMRQSVKGLFTTGPAI